MKVHRDIEQLPVFKNAVVTIGTFDGVHRGHQQIIKQLKEEALSIRGESVIITFHPHPRKILSGKKAVSLLNTLEEKTELLDKHGIDHLVVVPFTSSFSQLSAIEYIRDFLVSRFHPHTIIIGYDHRFGKGRNGNYKLLEQYAGAYNYAVKEIPEHVINQVTISSTKIREALLEGNIDEANTYLGYSYFFEGEVVHGSKLGRKLGYPTANLKMTDVEKLIPSNGIYAVTVEIDPAVISQHPPLKGMMSIGYRPTVGGTERTVEVNILDFDGDLYGKKIRIYLRKYLRPEIKFKSLEALKKQIDQDRVETLLVLHTGL
ncbi:MAG: bifunctional riboflavin kinase/FAD synthetase [Chitinophagaceae bacterium]|nr:bifunctional riboflavin kinase/FAD synthetase [Chitinophagaceae bacterium]